MLRVVVARTAQRIRRAKTVELLHHGHRHPVLLATCNFSQLPQKNEASGQSEPKQSTVTTIVKGVKGAVASVVDMVKNPAETWKTIKEVANHYWLGSKLLWSDIKVAKQILGRVLQGHSMTRRERMQLIRTSTDIFRLVPFSIFVIVPFMELLLPFALKLFPNMLPSTFQDSLKAEEDMKKELQMRIAMATFMQEAMQQMGEKKQRQSAADGAGDQEAAAGAREVIDFVEKARMGEHIPNAQVLRIARLFKEELTLANVPRPQLVTMCQYMGLQPYGTDSFLRFQLRAKLRAIQEDDRRILWEGIDSLNTIELRDACRERGMRSIGMTQFRLKKQLEEWLELSTQKGIPIFLLITSRAFMLTSGEGAAVDGTGAKAGAAARTAPPSDPDQVLQSSLSFLDADTINEVVLEAASGGEVDTPEMRRRRLESIQFQRELMEEERLEQERAKKAAATLPAGHLAPQLEQAPRTTAAETGVAHTRTSVVDPARIEEVAGDRQAIAAQASVASADKKSGVHSESSASSAAAAGIVPVAPPPTALVEVRAESATSEAVHPTSPLAATSSSAAGVAAESPADKSELTIYELVALSDLARGNPLRREMSELAVLEAFIESLPIDPSSTAAAPKKAKAQSPMQAGGEAGAQSAESTAVPAVVVDPSPADGWGEEVTVQAGSSGSGPQSKEGASDPEDRSVQMMKSVISSMVSKLKVRIDTTEKALGDKLKLLDSDGDGQISFDEVKNVASTVMKKGHTSAEQLEQLFQVLDSNRDGKVSVAELLHYIHKKKETREVELLEAQMKAAAAAAKASSENSSTVPQVVAIAEPLTVNTTSDSPVDAAKKA